ncbi:MAG: hypothetical protein F6K28_48310 [Microcoleus sp. SIO2G3]|nr:hypothetical protein [Microcoleus sp. SIO2G3]
MSKGFGKTQQSNPIADAADLLHSAARQAGRPLAFPMLPPGNEKGLQPGQIAPASPGFPASCDGLVVAVHCSAAEAQELLALLTDWQTRREEGDRPS